MFVGPSRTVSRVCSVSSRGASGFVTPFLCQLFVSLLQYIRMSYFRLGLHDLLTS